MPPIFKTSSGQLSFASGRRKLVLDAMLRVGWAFVTPGTAAIYPLWDRLLEAVRRNRPLTAAQWTRDIEVCVHGGSAMAGHRFVPNSGLAVDTHVAIELATFMTARSYFEGEVQVGTFVIDARLGRPPDGYFLWAERVGLLASQAGSDTQAVALSEMARARRHYRELA